MADHDYLGDLSTLSGTIWATLIGAVVGSVTGGAINLLIQITGIRIAQRERLAVKRQEDLATAFSAMVKIIKIFSAISNIRSDIKASLSNPNTKQIEVSDF